MISFSSYESYFKTLAEQFSLIAHTEESPRFAIMDIDDILGAQRGELDFNHYVMILENPEGGMNFKHDRILDENYGAFHILSTVNRGDPAQKRTVMDTTKAIGSEIIARIQLEKIARMKGNTDIPRMVGYFDLAQVKYQKVGPIFSDCFGWRFEINLGEEAPITSMYNPDNWT